MTKLLKLPGLIDVHVHLRDPGATQKEDFYTASRAALAGGVVGLVDMPNNPAPTINLKRLVVKKQAAKKSVCDYGFYFGANQENWKDFRKVFSQVFGLKIYMNHTTGPLLVEDLAVLQQHFKNWPQSKPILVHAEQDTLAKAIGLAACWDKWLHVCHLATSEELELVKKAKQKKIKVTCEVTPHHLFLTKDEVKTLGSLAVMRPPLQTRADLKSLWWGINKGIVDLIATDHAPHTLKEKQSSSPPNGIPGLETSLPLLLTALNENKITLKKLIELTSINPAKFLGLKSVKNSWVEVDLNKKWIIEQKNLQTKCGWSAFHGRKVIGKIERVFLRGKKVVENGKIIVKKGFGKPL